MRCFNCKHWNGDKEKIRADVTEYGDIVLDPVKGWVGSGDCEISFGWAEIEITGDACATLEVDARFGCIHFEDDGF